MVSPNYHYQTKAYRDMQLSRTLATLNAIVNRNPIASGRVVPSPEDIAIHDGRRLDATVMFLDISKFSQREAWTESEQAVLLRVLSLFFTEMIRVIQDHGGIVEKNTGDGLMAYFVKEPGDTISATQRGLSAALTMFYAADNFINPILQSSNLTPLAFRICMDHGPVTIAKVGTARGFNGIVAIGTTANIASKMLSMADPNTILLGTKALIELPASWQQSWAQHRTSDTGWFYRGDEKPYSYWVYTGRWLEPTV